MIATRKSPLLFALVVSLIMLGMQTPGEGTLQETLHQERSFFGVNKVVRSFESNSIELHHGTTWHGFQLKQTPRHEQIPTGYYHPSGPIGQVIRARRSAGSLQQVGILGLGAGTLTCNFEPGESVVFFEIDPVVIEIATSPAYFTFIRACGSETEIELGDGRLLLALRPDASFDLLIFDVFSSDAIPAHILTREALAMYLEKIRPGGLLAFHITSRHLDLGPVLARLADESGLTGIIQNHVPSPAETERTSSLASRWAVLARKPSHLEPVSTLGSWSPLEAQGMGDLWTDDFSNVLGTIGSYE